MVRILPVKYICNNCGYVLWSFERVGQDYYGVPTPEEVIRVHGGICPRCKKDLVFNGIEDIVIEPLKKLLETLDMDVNERHSLIDDLRSVNKEEAVQEA